MEYRKWPRFPLLDGPTPLENLEKTAAVWNIPGLFMKRDDCTGIGMGGNKLRKLEYLLADALNQKADTVITTGGVQSNHVRLTAAAAARAGLKAELVLRTEHPGITEADLTAEGNVLLDLLLDAGIHPVYAPTQPEWERKMEEVAAVCRAEGRRPYIIPSGGANALGSIGYFDAGMELNKQLENRGITPEAVVCACGSTGTISGLLAAKLYLKAAWKLIGINVGGPREAALEKIQRLTGECLKLLGQDIAVDLSEVEIYDNYLGAGYAHPRDLERNAILLAARKEGILLDPVYTGRAFGGMADLVHNRKLGTKGPLVFIHTGGVPALFAFDLLEKQPENR